MDCEICESPHEYGKMILCCDGSTLVCESCTDNIALEMTILRGEFKEGA